MHLYPNSLIQHEPEKDEITLLSLCGPRRQTATSKYSAQRHVSWSILVLSYTEELGSTQRYNFLFPIAICQKIYIWDKINKCLEVSFLMI